MKKSITAIALAASLVAAAWAADVLPSTSGPSLPTQPGQQGIPTQPGPDQLPSSSQGPIAQGDEPQHDRSWSFQFSLPQTAGSGPGSPGLTMKWLGGSGVEFCTGLGQCMRRPLPKAVGNPAKVFRVPSSAPTVPISVMVVSVTQRISWCDLTSLKAADAVLACRQVQAGQKRRTPGAANVAASDSNDNGDGSVTVRDAVAYMPNLTVLFTVPKPHNSLVAGKNTFDQALNRVRAAAAHTAAQRAIGKYVPRAALAAAGGEGGCEWDDEGNVVCNGGGGGGGGGGGSGPADGGGSGDDGGGYPSTDGGSGNGGGDDDGGQLPVPGTLPPPPVPGTTPPSTTNPNGCDPMSGICVITGQRPDPNTYDPETGQTLPEPTPSDDDHWYCKLPIIGWLVCGGSQPSDLPTPQTVPDYPPITIPDKYPANIPIGKFLEPHYSDEIDLCDKIADQDRKKCDLDDIYLGGPVLRRKQKEADQVGGKLPGDELRQLKKANNELSICLKKVDTEWGNCYKDAQDKWRVP